MNYEERSSHDPRCLLGRLDPDSGTATVPPVTAAVPGTTPAESDVVDPAGHQAPAAPAYGRTDPRPDSPVRGTVPLTSNATSGQGRRAQTPGARDGERSPGCAHPDQPLSQPRRARPALTPRRPFLTWLLDLIGKPA